MLTSTLSLSWSSLISAMVPVKSANGTLADPHRLAHFVLQLGLGLLGRLGALGRDLEEVLHVLAGQRRGLGARADEAGDAGRVANDVPGVVVELAAHEQVAGEHLAAHHDPLAVLELDDVLGGDDDLEDPVLHVHGGDAVLEVRLHLVLVAGVGVHDVPLAGTVVRALDRDDLVVVVALASSSSRSSMSMATSAHAVAARSSASTAARASLVVGDRRAARRRFARLGSRLQSSWWCSRKSLMS